MLKLVPKRADQCQLDTPHTRFTGKKGRADPRLPDAEARSIRFDSIRFAASQKISSVVAEACFGRLGLGVGTHVEGRVDERLLDHVELQLGEAGTMVACATWLVIERDRPSIQVSCRGGYRPSHPSSCERAQIHRTSQLVMRSNIDIRRLFFVLLGRRRLSPATHGPQKSSRPTRRTRLGSASTIHPPSIHPPQTRRSASTAAPWTVTHPRKARSRARSPTRRREWRSSKPSCCRSSKGRPKIGSGSTPCCPSPTPQKTTTTASTKPGSAVRPRPSRSSSRASRQVTPASRIRLACPSLLPHPLRMRQRLPTIHPSAGPSPPSRPTGCVASKPRPGASATTSTTCASFCKTLPFPSTPALQAVEASKSVAISSPRPRTTLPAPSTGPRSASSSPTSSRTTSSFTAHQQTLCASMHHQRQQQRQPPPPPPPPPPPTARASITPRCCPSSSRPATARRACASS